MSFKFVFSHRFIISAKRDAVHSERPAKNGEISVGLRKTPSKMLFKSLAVGEFVVIDSMIVGDKDPNARRHASCIFHQFCEYDVCSFESSRDSE